MAHPLNDRGYAVVRGTKRPAQADASRTVVTVRPNPGGGFTVICQTADGEAREYSFPTLEGLVAFVEEVYAEQAEAEGEDEEAEAESEPAASAAEEA